MSPLRGSETRQSLPRAHAAGLRICRPFGPRAIPSFHRRKRPSRPASVCVHGRRTNAGALVAQIFGTMKRQPNCFSAINAGGRAIAHHAHGNLAHDEISRFAPRRLKETKDWYAMVWHKHENRTGGGSRWVGDGRKASSEDLWASVEPGREQPHTPRLPHGLAPQQSQHRRLLGTPLYRRRF